MKTTLTFSLPEESSEFDDAIKGGDYKRTLIEMDDFLRSKIKYGEGYSEEVLEIYVSIRSELRSLAAENGVDV